MSENLDDSEQLISKDEKDFDRMVPIIIIFSCLTTVLAFVMIIVTLVKKYSEYSKSPNLQTHIAFNKNLDKDIEPDLLKQSSSQNMHKVYSLDQLNEVSFEGFTSLNPPLISSKYNTLPSRQIAIIESIYNKDQNQLVQTPKSILVKKVTFEKGASGSSSDNSSPTIDMSSFNEGDKFNNYLDMGGLSSQS